MEATYPGMVIAPDKGYDFAIGFDIDAVKPEDREALLFKVLEPGACERLWRCPVPVAACRVCGGAYTPPFFPPLQTVYYYF
jgi:hypothetical protein